MRSPEGLSSETDGTGPHSEKIRHSTHQSSHHVLCDKQKSGEQGDAESTTTNLIHYLVIDSIVYRVLNFI